MASNSWAQATPPAPTQEPFWFPLIVTILVWVIILAGLVSVQRAMKSGNWSIPDALSEATEITLTDDKGALKAGTKVTEMRASSSRTIAFIGSIVILALFIGFGSVVLHRYAVTGVLPGDVDKIIQFLLSGLGLFAPYAVNKLSSIGK